MISRSTLIAALVVIELVIVAAAGRAVSGHSSHWNFGGAFADQPPVVTRIDQTFETGAAPHVVLDVDNATVTVEAAAGTSVHVAGVMRYTHWRSGVKPALTVLRTADGVRVAAESGLTYTRSLEREVRITVPPGAQVEVLSAASVVASGLRGKLIARLGDGPVKVDNHRGDLDVTTSSGDVDLVDVQASALALRSDDGDFRLTSAGGDQIDAHTASGKITAVDLRAVDGALRTDDGHIDVGFASQSDAAVNLHTSDGRITGVGAAKPDTDGPDSRSLRLGSARGHFTVATGSGSISVTQGASV